MNKLTTLTLCAVLVMVMGGLAACGNRASVEPCRFVEIEDAEFEIDIGDVDVERGEVEMVCGRERVDVTWGQFRRKLRLDPGRYKDNLGSFRQQVKCIKPRREREQVLCQRPRLSDRFIALEFTPDD